MYVNILTKIICFFLVLSIVIIPLYKFITKEEESPEEATQTHNNSDVIVTNKSTSTLEKHPIVVNDTLSYLPINKNVIYTTEDSYGESVTEFLGTPQNIEGSQVYIENVYWGRTETEESMKFFHIINDKNDILTIGEELEDGTRTWYLEPEMYLPSKMQADKKYEYEYKYKKDLKGKLYITFLGFEEIQLNGKNFNCIVVKREKNNTEMKEYYAYGIGSVLKINEDSNEIIHEYLNMGWP